MILAELNLKYCGHANSSCLCCPKLFCRLWILAIHWWWRCATHRWKHARTYYIKSTCWSQKPITQNVNPSSLSETLLPHLNTITTQKTLHLWLPA